MNEIDKRVTELQEKMAFLEDTLQKMSDRVYEQQKLIDQNQRETKSRLEKMIADAGSNSTSEYEIPPHY